MRYSNIVKSQITRLILKNFRNYEYLDFSPRSNFIAITGSNGIGKTNILEAVSLLSPGKGLRGASLSEMTMFEKCDGWEVVAEIDGAKGLSEIVTGYSPSQDSMKRRITIDNHNSNQLELSKLFSISWLIPQMCHIFTDSSSSRRKMLDRMVSNFDLDHNKNLHSYEYYAKERSNLLKAGRYDEDWIDVIEKNMAKVAVMIATSRVEFTEIIHKSMGATKYNMPKFTLQLKGEMEECVYKLPSIQIESSFCNVLKNNRVLDCLSKRTNAGIHRSDLLVYDEDGVRADMCSTGEQKFLLMSVFLTEIIAQIKYRNRLPIILLDDVSAHLDNNFQEKFFEIVSDIQAQVWVTSISLERFTFLRDKSEFFEIKEDKLTVC